MKSSPRLRQLGVTTNSIAEDAVVELVSRVVGTVPGTYTDLETGAVTVSVFTEAPDRRVTVWRGELRAGLRGLAELGVDPAPGRLSVRKVRPQDWAESWKRHFRPLEIGSSLLVKPTWSRRKAA